VKRERILLSLFTLLISSSLACVASGVLVVPIPSPTAVIPIVTESGLGALDASHVLFCDVNTWALNVRGGPSVSWNVIRQLKYGDHVRVTEWWEGWGMVAPAEWVNARYLKCR
jgi:hypothetical protein